VSLDVLTEVVIARPRAEVAAFAANPENAPAWYVNIRLAEWKSEPPLGIGSKVAFVAHFLAGVSPTRTKSLSSVHMNV
jgi:hypothetical protein